MNQLRCWSVALLCWCACNVAAAEGELVGVWKLVSYTTTDPDNGESFYPFGKGATGYIEGNRLTIITPPLPTRPDGKLRVSTLVWERVE